MTKIEDGAVVLFQGDSITDGGRNRDQVHDLGIGYAWMTAALFGQMYPQKEVRFFNRGVGGDRVADLQERWHKDCLDLKPSWVSIYIGINDTWRRYDANDSASTEKFKETYRQLILQTKKSTQAKLILIEPFVLPVPADRKEWREDLDPKIQAIRELSHEFQTLYIPLDGLFAAASSQTSPAYWAPDGVHPSAAGHALIAKAWLNAVQAG